MCVVWFTLLSSDQVQSSTIRVLWLDKLARNCYFLLTFGGRWNSILLFKLGRLNGLHWGLDAKLGVSKGVICWDSAVYICFSLDLHVDLDFEFAVGFAKSIDYILTSFIFPDFPACLSAEFINIIAQLPYLNFGSSAPASWSRDMHLLNRGF